MTDFYCSSLFFLVLLKINNYIEIVFSLSLVIFKSKRIFNVQRHCCSKLLSYIFNTKWGSSCFAISLGSYKKWLKTCWIILFEKCSTKQSVIEFEFKEFFFFSVSFSDHLPAHKSNDDKLSLKKVLDLVNRGDVNMKEMNRKLQRMLEETLTKNMHLQKVRKLMSFFLFCFHCFWTKEMWFHSN